MYQIIKKNVLSENVVEYVIAAEKVAKHCLSGQFIILRVDADGERVPFTICDYDRAKGTVTILVQTVGYTTMKLAQKNEGDYISDFTGPLGNATDLSEYKNIVLVAGGIGGAVIYPQAKQLKADGNPSTVILGARTKELLIYEQGFSESAKELIIMTDDGSYGTRGFVTDALKNKLDANCGVDCVFAVGPLPMMRAVCNLTRQYGVKTIVSMNPIMVDGTGMCGGCRLTVGGKTKYACVDGPEFDGHEVDFEQAMARGKTYRETEAEHKCRIRG